MPRAYWAWATSMEVPAPGLARHTLLQLVIDIVVDGRSLRWCKHEYRADDQRLVTALVHALAVYPA